MRKKVKPEVEVITVEFAFDSSTKNKHRFYECDEDGKAVPQEEQVIGTLYLSRKVFKKTPDGIRLRFKPIFD